MSLGTGAGTPDPIRISDADRTEAIGRINQFFSEGRLDLDECSARLEEVYLAKTDADLVRVFRDLPKPAAPEPPRRRQRGRSLRSRTEQLVAVATPGIICTAVWGMTGHGYFWPEWVWFGTGVMALQTLRGGRGRRHHRGRAPELPPAGRSSRDERTVLTAVFSDIVGSTERAAAVRDDQWRQTIIAFERVADRGLSRRDGRKLFTKGDEVVATFRSPAQAIDYAVGLRDDVSELGLAVRSGIHTGEFERHDGDLSGIALHIGQRVSGTAEADEILVSSTVRDLAHGSGITFADRGEHQLRGLPGSWHLYAVEDGPPAPPGPA